MVSIGDIRRIDMAAFDILIGALSQRIDVLTEADLGLGDVGKLEGWDGDAADAARRRFVSERQAIIESCAEAGAVRRLAGDIEASMGGLKRALAEAEYLAERYLFKINDDSSILDLLADRSGYSEVELHDHDRMGVELLDRVEQIIRAAEDIDSDGVSVLKKAADGRLLNQCPISAEGAAILGAENGGLTPLDPPSSSDARPADNAGWWATLTDEQRAEVLADHPEKVGNLDGIPASIRSQANLSVLDEVETRLRAREEELVAEAARGGYSEEYLAMNLELIDTREKLAVLRSVRDSMSDKFGSIDPEKQLLLLDLGDFPKAAVAVGNVDTADHVAVCVSGTSSQVLDSPGDGNDLPGADERAQWLKTETEKQFTRAGREEETVAVVSWIGYQPPPGYIEAGFNNYAVDSGPVLADFVNGIDASRSGDAHMTLVGHSYGSLLASEALQQGTGVDSALFLGSPGLDTQSRDVFGVADMSLPSGDAYLVKAPSDSVAIVPPAISHYGPDPDGMDGLSRLSAHEGMIPAYGNAPAEYRSGSSGHSEYSMPETMSQYNQAIVIGGLPKEMQVQ